MLVSTILSVFGASLVLANPIDRSQMEPASQVVRRDSNAEAAAASSAAPPSVQTGAAPVQPNIKAAKKPIGPVKPSGGALTTGWVEPGSEDFIDICLYHHNVHRANHSATAVVWNSTLFNWAQQKAEACVWSESSPKAWGTVGMNIAGGSYGIPKKLPNPSDMISGLWYNSEMMNYPEYGVANPPMKNFENWGHFSQLVWPGSHQIGCGLADCGNKWFGLCLYKPAGNWLGEFNTIGAPRGYQVVYPNGQTRT